MNSFIKTEDHITVVFENGKTGSVYSSSPNFDNVCSLIKAGKFDEAYDVIFPAVKIERDLKEKTGTDRVRVTDGIVYLDDKPIHNTLTDRMIKMVEEGWDIAPMGHFLANLQDNTSYRAVNELYGFMEKSDLPITEDGCFIAYKRIRGDYKDIYSGTMDNSIGAVVKMDRNQVDEDKDRTCSAGLHFCSRSYLSSYGTGNGNRTVVLKINPRDVVSIPSDYNNAKGRCCRYEVISELTHGDERKLEGTLYQDPHEKALEELDTEIAELEQEIEQMQIEEEFEGVENTVSAEPVSDPTFSGITETGVVRYSDDEHGLGVKRYATIKEAVADVPGTTTTNIKRVCRGERKTCGGYMWKFATATPPSTANHEFEPSPSAAAKPQMIAKVDSQGIVQATYSSIDDASDKTGIGKTVLFAILDNGKAYDGYFWERVNGNVTKPTSTDLKASILDDFQDEDDEYDGGLI